MHGTEPGLTPIAGTTVTVPARELYPVDEAATLLGLSRRTIWYLIDRNEIESVKYRSKTLIPRAAIIAFVDKLRGEMTEARAKAEAAAR